MVVVPGLHRGLQLAAWKLGDRDKEYTEDMEHRQELVPFPPLPHYCPLPSLQGLPSVGSSHYSDRKQVKITSAKSFVGPSGAGGGGTEGALRKIQPTCVAQEGMFRPIIAICLGQQQIDPDHQS